MSLDDELPHQRALRELTPYLLDNVEYRVTDYIRADGFLSLDEMETIEEDRGERKRTRSLLRKLTQKPEDAFKSFINALKETSTHHVVDKLEQKLAAIQQESASHQHPTPSAESSGATNVSTSLAGPSGTVLKLKSLSQGLITSRSGVSHLTFGKEHFLALIESSDTMSYYEHKSGNFKALWQKSASQNQLGSFKPMIGLVLFSYSINSKGDIFLQERSIKNHVVSVCDESFQLIKHLPSPGALICLIGDQHALVASPCPKPSEGTPLLTNLIVVTLFITPINNLHDTSHPLEDREYGPYSYVFDNYFKACGTEDRRAAVLSMYNDRPCITFHDSAGKHVRRLYLPGPAGTPGCCSKYVLVPLTLTGPDRIYMFNCAGEQLHAFGFRDLGTSQQVESVSPVHEDDRFSVWVDKRVVCTYQLQD